MTLRVLGWLAVAGVAILFLLPATACQSNGQGNGAQDAVFDIIPDEAPSLPDTPSGPDLLSPFEAPTATPAPPPDITAPTAPPDSTAAAGDAVLVPMLEIAEISAGIPDYSRDEWKHWVDADRDCQNARAEVLIAESTASPTFADDRQCRVTGGHWHGPYTGETFTDASDVDIDHLVPLKNAHVSGGWRWDEARKEDYANSMAADYHLIAVDKSANRAKGAKGPEEWQPPDAGYRCQYARYWIAVKATWGLTATNAEWRALEGMLATCPFDVQVTNDAGAAPLYPAPVSQPDGAQTADAPPPAPTPANEPDTADPPPLSADSTDTLIISEFMANPAAVRDSDGEWVELYNPDPNIPVDIQGWSIGDADGDPYRIPDSEVIPPGGFLVLARSSDPAANGGLTGVLPFDDITLANDGDVIKLVNPAGQVTSRVEYGEDMVHAGASTARQMGGDAIFSSWCRSTTVMPNGDRGTPGAANDGC